MLTKCANPTCSTTFHYLRDGKVIRVEIENSMGSAADPAKPFLVNPRKPVRKVEHFWLCGPCSKDFDLVFSHGTGIAVVPKPTMVRRAAAS